MVEPHGIERHRVLDLKPEILGEARFRNLHQLSKEN